MSKTNDYKRLTFDPKRDKLYVYLINERTNKCY